MKYYTVQSQYLSFFIAKSFSHLNIPCFYSKFFHLIKTCFMFKTRCTQQTSKNNLGTRKAIYIAKVSTSMLNGEKGYFSLYKDHNHFKVLHFNFLNTAKHLGIFSKIILFLRLKRDTYVRIQNLYVTSFLKVCILKSNSEKILYQNYKIITQQFIRQLAIFYLVQVKCAMFRARFVYLKIIIINKTILKSCIKHN